MIFSLMLMFDNASALEICGKLKQGELLLLKDTEAKKINWQNKTYTLDNGEVLIAIPRDAPPHADLTIYTADSQKKRYHLSIAKTAWDIQRIEGVAQHHVTPNQKHQQAIVREQKDLKRALNVITNKAWWRNGFIEPVNGRISGHFGHQRIFNGVPKSPHNGTDIAAPQSTPVKAAGSGKIVLSGQDYFYTGNMLIIDHGQGLKTIYAHLQKSVVKEGDEVKKGDVIGYVGNTGRATGAHLHWGASWHNIRFRPHSLLGFNNKKCYQLEKIGE